MGLKFERAFSTHLCPALKRSALTQNVFVPRTISVHLQHNKRVRLVFGRGLENSEEEHKLGEIVSIKVRFS